MKRPSRVILATWFAMLTLQTIGSVDMKRKLPAPKQYVAICVLWGTLFLMADTGYGKLAARLSLLVLLTASVMGPFGAKFVQFLELVAQRFAIAPTGGFAPTQPPASAGPASSVQPGVSYS